MKVLLLIRPEFAFKIFSGEKKFEFRKKFFKDPSVKKVIVYASSPVQKVIGEFEIDRILHRDINSLWAITGKQSGITKKYFSQYFNERERGFAIKVNNVELFDTPRCIRKDYKATPPQSFMYIRN